MKGVVLITLNEFVEENYGIDKWEEILERASPPSKGIYTSVENYDDQEVISMVHALCEVLNLTRAEAMEAFGRYLFAVLNKRHPIFTRLQKTLIGFLSSVEDIVHTEVKKLFPDAYLPTLRPIERSEKRVLLEYVSERKMCDLAEGLIRGAAEYYQVKVEIEQLECYCRGDEHCLIEVRQL